MGQFWVCVLLCFLTPFYLLPAVRQARSGKIGLGPGGGKLKLFSRAYFYFQGIKVVQAGLAPQRVARVEALKAMPHKFKWLRRPEGVGRPQKLALWADELKAAVEQQADAARRAAGGVRARL